MVKVLPRSDPNMAVTRGKAEGNHFDHIDYL